MTAVVGTSAEELARRVDSAARAVAGLDGPARAAAEELKAAVEAVHREGMTTIVRAMKADDAARAVLFALVDDPVVHLLLSLHGIVRPDPVTQADRVLAQVRPRLHDHGGDVVLVRIADGVAHVRLEGARDGCSTSSAALRDIVEKALVDGVPAVRAVEVEPPAPAPTLIPVQALFAGPAREREGWVRAARAADVAEGALTPLTAGTAELVLVRLGGRITAYVNACAHEGLPLDDALLDTENGTLTCPWHGFCYDANSGECLSAPGARLEPLPSRVDDGDVWVRTG